VVVLPVQDIDHLGRFGEFLGVKEELVPVFASLPGVPVLHDAIDGNLAGPVFRGDAQQLFAVLIVLLAFASSRRPTCRTAGRRR